MTTKSKMLWGGRFSEGPKEKLLKYNSLENSSLDLKLAKWDVLGSIAHVKMLAKQGILKEEEGKEIVAALKKVLMEIERGEFQVKPELEDVHMNVEARVTELTPLGKKMHTARSRNDQVILDTRLWMREEVLKASSLLLSLCKSLEKLKGRKSPFVAYTHTRVAQPITLAFWADGWQKSFVRDLERLFSLYSRVNKSPLGACAVAGTGWKIDRAYTAKLLGFEAVEENAHDVSTSRGELEGEVIYVLTSVMCKLSRICEELIFLSQKGLVSIPDAYCTGSSIMPQKKNADFLEIMRGRASRCVGNLCAVMSIQKGLISGYNSDSQETKPLLFSTFGMAEESVSLMAEVLPQVEVDSGKVIRELEEGYACATELADLLAQKGVPFRDAHEIAGKTVKECIAKGVFLSKVSAKEVSGKCGKKISEQELKKALTPDKTGEERFRVGQFVAGEWEKKIGEMKKKAVPLL